MNHPNNSFASISTLVIPEQLLAKYDWKQIFVWVLDSILFEAMWCVHLTEKCNIIIFILKR